MSEPAPVNIYCDESAHLPHSRERFMILGAVSNPVADARRVAEAIRAIKKNHRVWSHLEIKWTKVSKSKLPLLEELVTFFIEEPSLSFRGLVADTDGLKHDAFWQTHDDWYYKMFYFLLHPLLTPEGCYRVYLDMKDTRGGTKVARLHKVLRNKLKDHAWERIQRVEQVRSHEVEQIQIADLLIGAIGYANRPDQGSAAKLALMEFIREKSGRNLLEATPLSERKFNLFRWRPQEVESE